MTGEGEACGLRPDGSYYLIGEAQRAEFDTQGYVHLPGVLTEEEMREVVDPVSGARAGVARGWRRRERRLAGGAPARPHTPCTREPPTHPQVYQLFMERKIEVPGKDLCDMSGERALRAGGGGRCAQLAPRPCPHPHPPAHARTPLHHTRRKGTLPRRVHGV